MSPSSSAATRYFLSAVTPRSAKLRWNSGQSPPTRSFVPRSHTRNVPLSSPATAHFRSGVKVADRTFRPLSACDESKFPFASYTSYALFFTVSPTAGRVAHTPIFAPSVEGIAVYTSPVGTDLLSRGGETSQKCSRPVSRVDRLPPITTALPKNVSANGV